MADRLQRMLEAKDLEFYWYAAGAARLAGPLAGAACVVLDLTLEAGNEVACFEQVKANGYDLPVIVLAGVQLDIRRAVQIMRAGAADILIEPLRGNEFLPAIAGALQQSRDVLQRRVLPDDLLPQLALLTAREREIVNLILAGLLNKQIAEQLHLALVTVKAHRGHAMRKLGARNAAELARIALGTHFFGDAHPLPVGSGR